MLKRVLVGIDGSKGSERAVEWCMKLTAGTQAEVIAVACHVHRFELGKGGNQELRDELDPHVERACSVLSAAGVECRKLVVDGDARHALIQVADREDVDLIVVGSRGRSQLSDLVLGSVASYLMHHSQRPVTVVR